MSIVFLCVTFTVFYAFAMCILVIGMMQKASRKSESLSTLTVNNSEPSSPAVGEVMAPSDLSDLLRSIQERISQAQLESEKIHAKMRAVQMPFAEKETEKNIVQLEEYRGYSRNGRG